MVMGPMNKLDTAPPLHIQFKQGGQNFSLAGLAATAIILHLFRQSSQTYKRGAGYVIFTDAPSGKCDYYWNEDDTNLPGLWDVWSEIVTSNGPQSSTNVEILEITDRMKGFSFNVKNFGGRIGIRV